MIKSYLIFSILFLYASITSAKNQCPEINLISHDTINGMGKSSYFDGAMGLLNKGLYDTGLLKINKPILIIGAGYGAGVHEFLSLGADKIYLNDLSSKNLYCAKKFIDLKNSDKKNSIIYLPGNINDVSVLSKIPDHSLGFIYARNIIHFLNASQLIQLIHDSNKKLEHNGLVFFVFENPVLDWQTTFIKNIDDDYKNKKITNKNIKFDNLIREHYIKNNLCSIKEYDNTPFNIRGNGFPCIVKRKNIFINLLMPKKLMQLLSDNGFQEIFSSNLDGNLEKHANMYLVVARKITI